jgi:adenylate cyclase
VQADAGGYQLLLNWRKPLDMNAENQACKMLNDTAIAPEQIRDRIVLIGMTADSAGDDYFTPFTQLSFNFTAPLEYML